MLLGIAGLEMRSQRYDISCCRTYDQPSWLDQRFLLLKRKGRYELRFISFIVTPRYPGVLYEQSTTVKLLAKLWFRFRLSALSHCDATCSTAYQKAAVPATLRSFNTRSYKEASFDLPTHPDWLPSAEKVGQALAPDPPLSDRSAKAWPSHTTIWLYLMQHTTTHHRHRIRTPSENWPNGRWVLIARRGNAPSNVTFKLVFTNFLVRSRSSTVPDYTLSVLYRNATGARTPKTRVPCARTTRPKARLG